MKNRTDLAVEGLEELAKEEESFKKEVKKRIKNNWQTLKKVAFKKAEKRFK